MPQVWRITPQVQQAAQLTAQDWTHARVAQELGLAVRTIEGWAVRPAYRALVEQYAEHVADISTRNLEEFADSLNAGAREMVALWREMVAGRVKANDERFRHVGPLVAGWFHQSFDFTEPALAEAKAPDSTQATAAVQVNVNTGTPSAT